MKKLVVLLVFGSCLISTSAQSIDDFFDLQHQVESALRNEDDSLSFRLNQEHFVVVYRLEKDKVCGGGCVAETLKLEGGLNKHPSTLCKYYRKGAIYRLKNVEI